MFPMLLVTRSLLVYNASEQLDTSEASAARHKEHKIFEWNLQIIKPQGWRRFKSVAGMVSDSPELLERPWTSQNFYELPRKVLGHLSGTSLTAHSKSNPRLPRSSPDFPGSSPDLPRGQPLCLGSLTPSGDSRKVPPIRAQRLKHFLKISLRD